MSNDLISRKAVMDEINSLTVTVTGLRAGKGVLNEFAKHYKESVLRILDEAATAYDVDKVVEKLDKEAQMLYSIHAFEPVKAWENKYLIPIVKAGE